MVLHTIKYINWCSENEFIAIFENIVEHYSSCAVYLSKKRPYDNARELINNAEEYLNNLSTEEQEKILNLHPDLAGKIHQLKTLTYESQREQISAGLDQISVEDAEELNALNEQYKVKFNFPFVICARENKFAAILNGLKERINNTKEEEIKTAINEVKKITKYRILELVDH